MRYLGLAVQRIVQAVVCIGLVLLTVPLATAAPADSLVSLPGHVLPALSKARAVALESKASADESMTLTLVLKRGDQAGFDRYLRDVYDPASPGYRKFLTPTELAERFGPSREAYAAVLGYLGQNGFTLVEGSANRLTLTVRGSRSSAERAFAVRIGDYEIGSRTFRANDVDPAVPATLASSVQSVTGLSDLAQPRPNIVYTVGKALCKFALTAAGGDPTQVKQYIKDCITWVKELSKYDGPVDTDPPGWDEFRGAGQTIGLIQFDTFQMTDVADFLALIGRPASQLANVSEVKVNGGAPPGPDQSEVLLDITTVLAIARDAKIVVYSGPFTGAGTSFQALFNAAINGGSTIISNSWAYCEDQTTAADVQSIDAIFQTAAAAGISIFNASGDTGSTCLDGAANTVAVPVGSPNATAVGGSSASRGPGNTYGTETWWDGTGDTPPTGQGGFGVSKFFARPSYQDGFTASVMRSVPDVVANADPARGVIICQASAGGCPNTLFYGGTSMAAPAWAAFAAILNHALGQNIGAFNQAIYPFANTSAFHDAASMGSDFAHVGLGSPNLNQLYLKLSGQTVGMPSAALSGIFPYLEVPLFSSGAPYADGQTQVFVNVRLLDANGNPVPGKTVTLAASPGSQAVIAPPSAVSTLDNGIAVFTVTNLAAETVTLTATDVTDGIVLQQTESISFVTPPAAAAGINASPTAVTANGIATTTITVTLRDALNRPTPGKLVTLSQGNGHSLITGPSPSVTDANGQIQFTATNLVNEVVTYKATDVTDGDLAVPGEGVVTFSNGSGGACGQNTPLPVGLNGYTVTPFATGFATGQLFFSNVNYGGCAGVAPTAFFGGSLYAPNFLNGDLFKLEPTGGAVSNANKLSTLGPTLGWLVVGKDGRLYGLRSGTGGNFNTGIVIELDPSTGGIIRTLASGLTCPAGLAVDPLSGDLFFIDQCFGAGSDNPSLFRVKDPGTANPTLVVYATLPSTPNGQVVFSPKGSIYAVSNYLLANPTVVRVSGTDGPNPPTVTALSGVFSSYWLNIGAVGPDGEATVLITLNNGKLRLTDITTNPPTVTAELTENVGGGVIGPDGCLYMPNANAVYKLTDPTGGCSFLPTNAAPLLALTPTAVSPDPAQGTGQAFTATFRNVSVPADTPVTFQVTGANAQIKLVRTDANGQAAFGYTAVSTGPDTIVATATVDASALTSNKARVTWVAGKHVAFLALNQSPTTGMTGAPVTVTAALADVSLDPAARVTGASISFAVAGGSCVAVTDADGIASCELMPTGAPGTTTLSASFAGSSGFTPATAAVGFVLLGSGEGGLSGVGPAHLWVGLKNSDDIGTQFDLKVDVLIGDTLVAQGQTRCVTGLIRNPSAPREVVVPLQLSGDTVADGDVLRVKVWTRIGTTPQGARCAGPGGSHASARGLRLYYDGVKAPSNIGLQLPSEALEDFFLDSDGGVCANRPNPPPTTLFLGETAPSAATVKCRDSGTVNFARGNPWQVIGTWNLPLR